MLEHKTTDLIARLNNEQAAFTNVLVSCFGDKKKGCDITRQHAVKCGHELGLEVKDMAAIVRKTLYPLDPMGRYIQSCDKHYKIYNAIRRCLKKDDQVILHRVLQQDIEEYITIPLSEVLLCEGVASLPWTRRLLLTSSRFICGHETG